MRETKDLNVKRNKGITLIALVITIIVMLILVAVTVTMAVSGGLFGHAQTAAKETNRVMAEEQELGNGKINIAGKLYNSPQEYVDTLTGKTTTDPDYCETCDGSGAIHSGLWFCLDHCGSELHVPVDGFGIDYTCSCTSSARYAKTVEELDDLKLSLTTCNNCQGEIVWGDLWSCLVCKSCGGGVSQEWLLCLDCNGMGN